jgi:hypothetical protein
MCRKEDSTTLNQDQTAGDTSLEYVDNLNDITTSLRDKVHVSTVELSHYLVDEMVNSLQFFPQENYGEFSE